MGQMAEPGNPLDHRLRLNFRDPDGATAGRNRPIAVGGDQHQLAASAGQRLQQRLQIPVRHHPQRRGDMGRAAHQLAVQRHAGRIDASSRCCRSAARPRPACCACQANSRGTNGIQHQHLRQRREQIGGVPAIGQEGAVEADQQPAARFCRRGTSAPGSRRRRNGRPRSSGSTCSFRSKRGEIGGHARQRQPVRQRRLGEAVAGQIRRDHA